MENKKIIEVYVTLFDEGTDTIRGTDAEDLGNGLARLLPTSNYDPEDETWEFLPGSVVKIKAVKDFLERDILLAYEEVKNTV